MMSIGILVPCYCVAYGIYFMRRNQRHTDELRQLMRQNHRETQRDDESADEEEGYT
ncbi:hypothetical protein RHMOL_Rhmol12G0022400 [Rhododendron molle]|uniref:Uncharacterized protein n=1 Tax=Rhododendron molle TaxID=49168 RepID=A0ACC0LER9_RHOML|nr:hypothetical protein RHMOL_Rhmol12G0022400 [Rhododendron molle]